MCVMEALDLQDLQGWQEVHQVNRECFNHGSSRYISTKDNFMPHKTPGQGGSDLVKTGGDIKTQKLSDDQ